MSTEHYVLFGDATELSQVADESMDLVLSYPPFFNTYTSVKRPLWGLETCTDYDEYLRLLFKSLDECKRLTKPDRFIILLLHTGGSTDRPGYYPVVGDMQVRAREIGLVLHDVIYWSPTLGGAGRQAVVYQYPYPGYYYSGGAVRTICVWKKWVKGTPLYSMVDREVLERHKLDHDYLVQYRGSHWYVRPEFKRDQDGPDTPPMKLSEALIRFYSFEGDWVFEPFSGSGRSIGIPSIRLGRNTFMVELCPNYRHYYESWCPKFVEGVPLFCRVG